jgi:hypothetical protein
MVLTAGKQLLCLVDVRQRWRSVVLIGFEWVHFLWGSADAFFRCVSALVAQHQLALLWRLTITEEVLVVEFRLI